MKNLYSKGGSIKTEIQVLDKQNNVVHTVDVTGKSDRTVLRIVSGMQVNLHPDYKIAVQTSE